MVEHVGVLLYPSLGGGIGVIQYLDLIQCDISMYHKTYGLVLVWYLWLGWYNYELML